MRIFIVEDHSIMRQSLRALLEQETDLTVIGEAATAELALELIGQEEADLVLIDVSLPGISGIELARALRQEWPALPLVMLSGHREKSHVDQAFEAGASGYILKGSANELPGALRRVFQGERYVSPTLPDEAGDEAENGQLGGAG